jgi:hypothetical protein
LIESGSPVEAAEPVKETLEPAKEEQTVSKEDPNEIESMAEMSTSDDHHWSNLKIKTDSGAEKIPWSFDNSAATDTV